MTAFKGNTVEYGPIDDPKTFLGCPLCHSTNYFLADKKKTFVCKECWCKEPVADCTFLVSDFYGKAEALNL